jgi:hypothetical protein
MNDDPFDPLDPLQKNQTWLEYLTLPIINLFLNHEKAEKASKSLSDVSSKLAESLEKTSYLPGNTSELLQLTGKIVPSTIMAAQAGQRGAKVFKHLTNKNVFRKPGFYLNTASCICCATSCGISIFGKIGPTLTLQTFLYSTGSFLGKLGDGVDGDLNPP